MKKAEKKMLFKFASGEEPIVVGQKVFYYGKNSRSSGTELVIEKIGKSLLHLNYRTVFHLEDGSEKVNCGIGGHLYTSKEAWALTTKKERFISEVKRSFERSRPTFEQAKQINDIMAFNIKLE